MPSLQAVDVSCVRRDRELFSNVNLDLLAGSLVYLSGPNGAGKTSFLRILIGFVQPAYGSVMFNGSSIANEETRRALAKSLVYIGHKSAVNPHASALENSLFWCQQQGISVSESQIFDVLTMLGLVGLEDVPCGQLSAGQNRRVALARLWFKQEAKIWILDEPFTALDVDGIRMLEEWIESFLQSGGSVVMTSHQPLSYLTGWQELKLEYQI